MSLSMCTKLALVRQVNIMLLSQIECHKGNCSGRLFGSVKSSGKIRSIFDVCCGCYFLNITIYSFIHLWYVCPWNRSHQETHNKSTPAIGQ